GTWRSAPPRPQCFVGADGPVARHVDVDRIYRDRHVAAAGGKLSCVGLAAAVLRERRAGRVRSVDPRRRGGNAAVPATRTRQVAGTRTGRRGVSRALAEAPDRRWRTDRSRCSLLARSHVLALLPDDDSRRIANTRVDLSLHRRRLQRADDSSLRLAVRPLRSSRRVWNGSAVRTGGRLQLLPFARHRIASRN